MKKYKIKQFISEDESKSKIQRLINVILSGKHKSLLVSPMKAGKTTFVLTTLLNELSDKGIQLIYVSPKVTLLEQIKLNSKIEVGTCYGKRCKLDLKDGQAVITTPDSMYKVVDKCRTLNKKFFVVYDEAHELELSYNFRKKLAYPIKYYNDNDCLGLLCMTATPDNIAKSIKWDHEFLIEVENKFIQSKTTNIVTGLNSNVETITNYIIKVHKEHDTTIIVRINDKSKIDKVKELLKNTINIEPITWYRDRKNENEKGDLHLQSILDGAKLGNEIILTTSLVDVGVEIYSKFKPVVASFMDNNSTLIEEIQFIGRFRDGVEEFNLIVPTSKHDGASTTYSRLHKLAFKDAELNKQCANVFDRDQKTLRPNLLVTDCGDKYSYEIDEIAVNAMVFKTYIKQIIKDPSLLRKYLMDHLTFNSEVIRIVNVNDKAFNNNQEVKELNNELIQQDQEAKEIFKQEVKAFREKVKALNTGQIKVLLTPTKDLDSLTIFDKKIFDTIEEEYYFYHNEDMKEYRSRFYRLVGLLTLSKSKVKEIAENARGKDWFDFVITKGKTDLLNTLIKQKHVSNDVTEQDLLLKILDDGEYKKFELQLKYVWINQKYNLNFPVDKKNKLETKIYMIRDTIIKLKEKERDTKLSEKFKGELLEELKENKCFSKMTTKALEKHLDMIYNTNDQSIIKSAITRIKI